MSKNPKQMTLRDSSILKIVKKDIVTPSFYDKLSDMKGVELTQGQYFVERSHYSKDDQFVCMIEGTAHIRLVPHVNYNSMYAG